MSWPAKSRFYCDPWLLGCALVLSIVGLLTVASASMVISDRFYHHPFHFLFHQGVYWLLSMAVGAMVYRIDMQVWCRWAGYLLLLSLLLLVVVLIPGIGHTVNGSRRWVSLGMVMVQVSEWAKLAVIIYFASYLMRRGQWLKDRWKEVIKPLCIIFVVAFLLLLEPDYGTMAVIVATILGMLFLGGLRIWQMTCLLCLAALVLLLLAWVSPYRLARLTSFMHPWQQQFSGGYQLTQSLIALGRGGIFGVGLGNSIQKLFYLPEAHTDFIFAILTEELGFLGGGMVICIFTLLVARMGWVARCAFRNEHYFNALVVCGVGLWISLQALVNIGVNVGLFPTKGITLPFMSYGGSSLLVCAVALAMVLRIAHECHVDGSVGIRSRGQVTARQ